MSETLFDNKYEITASFGTGPSGKGYTLGSITISFNNIVGQPGRHPGNAARRQRYG